MNETTINPENKRGTPMPILPDQQKASIENSVKVSLQEHLVEVLQPEDDLQRFQIEHANSRLENDLLSMPASKIYKLPDGTYLTEQITARGIKLMYQLSADKYHTGNKEARIKRILVEAPSTEPPHEPKVVALNEVFPEEFELILDIDGRRNRTDSDQITKLRQVKLIPYTETPQGEIQVERILHESGHAWIEGAISLKEQLKRTAARGLMIIAHENVLGSSLAKFAEKFALNTKLFHAAKEMIAQEERDPHAIALLVHRAYKYFGVDLTPGLSGEDLRAIPQSDLALYQKVMAQVPPKAPGAIRPKGFVSAWYPGYLARKKAQSQSDDQNG